MLRKKNIRNFFNTELKVVFGIVILVLVFWDFIKTNIKPPVMEFIGVHMDLLKFLILFILLFCSLSLIFIVWWLEWGDKNKHAVITKYITQLVCDNYYGDYRKTDVYKAIRTCLSKFSREDVQEEGVIQRPRPSHASGRYVDTQGFIVRAHPQEEPREAFSEDTSDGFHRTYFSNGSVEKEVSYKNNMLDGIYKTYYEDGRLHQERYYKKGKLDGIYKAYDEYGVLYFDISYREGKQDGITNTYYKTGILQYRDTFKDGKRINRESYSETGELKFSQQENNM